jgi:3'5'-cyclic nucleotide phosphodiesterase/Adenylate and Guanylate cyclase catalytic domain
MSALTKQLEIALGPSTGDLKGRCGLHSGPVTAGVLRGQKARFQLFGDTMNTASRIESSGIPGRIHVSRETAALLEEAGRADWVVPRNEKVTLKGKGELQTFFVYPTPKHDMIIFEDSSDRAGFSFSLSHPWEDFDIGNEVGRFDRKKEDRMQRLVRWNVEILYSHLVNIVVRRRSNYHRMYSSHTGELLKINYHEGVGGDESSKRESKKLLLDEMTESIDMPEFTPGEPMKADDLIPSSVKQEVQTFVVRIAELYRDVSFHNFEHASHVTMSAGKLMKRIMNPEEIDITQESAEIARSVHLKTYGISSDPLMQFAVVFSALIHDVDHTGFTNKELIDSNASVVTEYGGRSVAEQNSVEVAWSVLMHDEFAGLRSCIYSSGEEKQRFRQLVVNAVMATDIADKELQRLRKSRWDATFSPETTSTLENKELADRKATIVFEYIIQASDVIHCMQHWLTYQKFNARLFEERYVAWLQTAPAGTDDPSKGWYAGEIWFFDNYIIPLAQKLHECGVFGVSYYESLSYAQQNRVEWERKGHEIVDQMLVQCQSKYGPLDCSD